MVLGIRDPNVAACFGGLSETYAVRKTLPHGLSGTDQSEIEDGEGHSHAADSSVGHGNRAPLTQTALPMESFPILENLFRTRATDARYRATHSRPVNARFCRAA